VTAPVTALPTSIPRARHTTGPAGTPNATPVWGVVVDEVVYHYTESRTLKARNLASDSRVMVHLESASDVLIVHGRLTNLGRPGDHPEVVRAFEQKYATSNRSPAWTWYRSG
jgi:Pyridoxamine 5'-phosphate oxidase